MEQGGEGSEESGEGDLLKAVTEIAVHINNEDDDFFFFYYSHNHSYLYNNNNNNKWGRVTLTNHGLMYPLRTTCEQSQVT